MTDYTLLLVMGIELIGCAVIFYIAFYISKIAKEKEKREWKYKQDVLEALKGGNKR